MARYGESFLTRPILITGSRRWANGSRMQFRDIEIPTGKPTFALSWLGVINGFPILSKYWRLACTLDEDTNEIIKWGVIKASRCLPQKL